MFAAFGIPWDLAQHAWGASPLLAMHAWSTPTPALAPLPACMLFGEHWEGAPALPSATSAAALMAVQIKANKCLIARPRICTAQASFSVEVDASKGGDGGHSFSASVSG